MATIKKCSNKSNFFVGGSWGICPALGKCLAFNSNCWKNPDRLMNIDQWKKKQALPLDIPPPPPPDDDDGRILSWRRPGLLLHLHHWEEPGMFAGGGRRWGGAGGGRAETGNIRCGKLFLFCSSNCTWLIWHIFTIQVPTDNWPSSYLHTILVIPMLVLKVGGVDTVHLVPAFGQSKVHSHLSQLASAQ